MGLALLHRYAIAPKRNERGAAVSGDDGRVRGQSGGTAHPVRRVMAVEERSRRCGMDLSEVWGKPMKTFGESESHRLLF
jgi:hypothetical protein